MEQRGRRPLRGADGLPSSRAARGSLQPAPRQGYAASAAMRRLPPSFQPPRIAQMIGADVAEATLSPSRGSEALAVNSCMGAFRRRNAKLTKNREVREDEREFACRRVMETVDYRLRALRGFFAPFAFLVERVMEFTATPQRCCPPFPRSRTRRYGGTRRRKVSPRLRALRAPPSLRVLLSVISQRDQTPHPKQLFVAKTLARRCPTRRCARRLAK